MKEILIALNAMGKATCRELSTRLSKDPRDLLEILERMEDQGEIHAVNGYWQSGRAPKVEKENAKTAAVAEQPKPTTLEAIAEQLRKHGPMGTKPLAGIFCRDGRGMASIMCSLAMRGLVIKNGKGKGVTWSLPASDSEGSPAGNADEPNAASADVVGAEKQSTEALLSDIPVFVSRPTDLILPTAAGISNELRRARARVASLEKLRDMTREIRRHKNLILSLRGDA